MDLNDLMGRVIDALYDGLTGGNAELPLPDNAQLNWLMPGMRFHESAFDFAIAGPYAGPTPLTLDDFRKQVEALALPEDEGGEGLDRNGAIDKARVLYQQNLLGTWEQWSRLVDFIPLPVPSEEGSRWRAQPGAGKHKHVSVVYGQTNRTLSQVYRDTLLRSEVADDPLSDEQRKLIERMRALLSEDVEVEDFLTGEKRIEPRESRAMIAYKEKRSTYENAVTDYGARLARANAGTVAELVEWQRTGGIYRRRATEALRDWIATGYKADVERAQATLSHLLGSSMVVWKDNLLQIVEQIENDTTGAFGYPFFPASVIPGSFARSPGWPQFSQMNLHQTVTTSSSSRRGQASLGFQLGLFSIGGAGGGGVSREQIDIGREEFGLSFEYTTVEIMRPAFNANFFLSRGWRPKDEFVRDYGPLHSDGGSPPSGALIGYPTKALFVRNLFIRSRTLSDHLKTQVSDLDAGGIVGFGPFVLGGRYQQASRATESNLDIDGAEIRIPGLQLVGFMSILFPYAANPSPDIRQWI